MYCLLFVLLVLVLPQHEKVFGCPLVLRAEVDGHLDADAPFVQRYDVFTATSASLFAN